jgi:beta-lactamase superfamily II metal-dependent hydrolase
VAAPDPIPAAKLATGNFLAAFGDDDLLHFVLNVGDGDTQLLCLPKGRDGRRRALVVDVATTKKLPALVLALEAAKVLEDRPDLFALVVATHPHLDHIGGMAEFLHQFHDHVTEFWEPGYYMTSATYVNTMNALEEHGIQVTQPTSGTAKFIGRVRVQALSPAIALRNRFDTYGVEPNNSSITLKVEFPATRITDVPGEERRYVPLRDKTRSLILGADAQTLSWSYVLVDFPDLEPKDNPISKRLEMALGTDALRAEVVKISHHGSKHGVNLELIERIGPKASIVSSVAGLGKYGFPHTVAQDCIREGLEATSSGQSRSKDFQLGIHYTSGTDDTGAALGSVGVIVPPPGKPIQVWRFGDAPGRRLDLTKGRRVVP